MRSPGLTTATRMPSLSTTGAAMTLANRKRCTASSQISPCRWRTDINIRQSIYANQKTSKGHTPIKKRTRMSTFIAIQHRSSAYTPALSRVTRCPNGARTHKIHRCPRKKNIYIYIYTYMCSSMHVPGGDCVVLVSASKASDDPFPSTPWLSRRFCEEIFRSRAICPPVTFPFNTMVHLHRRGTVCGSVSGCYGRCMTDGTVY